MIKVKDMLDLSRFKTKNKKENSMHESAGVIHDQIAWRSLMAAKFGRKNPNQNVSQCWGKRLYWVGWDQSIN